MKYSTLTLTMVASLALFSGCATMTEQKVHQTPVAVEKTSPTIVKAEKQVLKRKVAIGRFSNETKYGQSFFIDKNNDKIGKQAMDILSAKLFDTGKFLMLERADISKIKEELKIANGNTQITTAADYLIIGSITEFGRKDVSDVGVFSRVKKQEAFAKVHIRIVDVQTGQITYSEEGQGIAFSEAGTVMGVGDKAGYDSSLNDKAIDAAIGDLISNIVGNMLDKPWRGYILAEEEGNLIISGGTSQNIMAGDQFDVLQRGKKINNPQTGIPIELPGKKVASLQVLTTVGDTPENEISICEIISGNNVQLIQQESFKSLYIQPQQQVK